MMEDSWTHGGGAYAGEEMGEWRGGEHYYDGMSPFVYILTLYFFVVNWSSLNPLFPIS